MSSFDQRRGDARHDRVLARARLVVAQRLREVVGMLAGELREIGHGLLPSAPWQAAQTSVAFALPAVEVAPARRRRRGSAAARRGAKRRFRRSSFRRRLEAGLRRSTRRGRPCPGPRATPRSRASTDGCARRSCTPAAPSRGTPRAGRRSSGRGRPRERRCASPRCRGSPGTSASSARPFAASPAGAPCAVASGAAQCHREGRGDKRRRGHRCIVGAVGTGFAAAATHRVAAACVRGKTRAILGRARPRAVKRELRPRSSALEVLAACP